MPTQENLGASPSANATKKGKPSGTLVKEALAVAAQSTQDMPTHTTSDLSKNQALAIAWTGIEALALMKQANLYRSPRTGRVVIELLDTEYTIANGLVSIGTPVNA